MINELGKVHHLGFEIVDQTAYPLSMLADVICPGDPARREVFVEVDLF